MTYDVNAVLADTQLVANILNSYTDLRKLANESWYECLEASIRKHKEFLKKYRKD